MPVHRMPGERGRVWADPKELDQWRLGKPTAAPSETPPRIWRRYILAGTAAVLLILLAVIVGWRSFSRPVPSAWSVEGRTLTMRNSDGAVLWRHTFDVEPVSAGSLERQPHDVRALLADFDGDGAVELLYRYSLPYAAGAPDVLYCFDADGQIRWRFKTIRTVRSAKPEEFPPPYSIRTFSPVNLGSGRQGVVVSSVQAPMYPARVALLSAEGKELAEYWHSGHLQAILTADRNGDGRDEIYLGGVSNSYRRATLVVLDPVTMAGASREENSDYQIQGFPAPVEIARLLFRRTRVGAEGSSDYNIVANLMLQGDFLNVHIAEETDKTHPAMVYLNLNRSLHVTSASANDALMKRHRERFSSAQPGFSLDDQIRELVAGVDYLTPPAREFSLSGR